MEVKRQWISFSPSTPNVMLLLVLTLLQRANVEALQIIGGNVTVVQGGTAVLPCKLTGTMESLTLISWQRKTRGKPKAENFLTISPIDQPKYLNGKDERFSFIGSTADYIGSLQLTNVTLMDEGIYICIFTLFPSGNSETEIPLNLLVPPVSSVKVNHPALGTEEVSLVTCMAAGSRPPAEVMWIIDSLPEKVRETTSSTQHNNGTTTTISRLLGVPTKKINQLPVQCVVTFVAIPKKEILRTNLQVYFPPMEVNIQKQDDHSFECVFEANPPANITWSRVTSSWPESSVRVEAATLQFLKKASDLNGLYQCEASNIYGSNRGSLYMFMSPENCLVPWILFWLLFALVVLAVLWYLYKSGKLQSLLSWIPVFRGNERETGAGAEADNLSANRENL